MAERKEMRTKIANAIEKLSEDYKEILLMEMENKTYNEMADQLGIPTGTVMTRLHRARERLAEELKEYAPKTKIAEVEERARRRKKPIAPGAVSEAA